MIVTLQDRLSALRAMLEATENLLAPPEHEENAETVRGRHAVAAMNAKRITDEALKLERDLESGLSNPVFLEAILMRYVPSHRSIPDAKTLGS